LNLLTTPSLVYALILRRKIVATEDGLPVLKSKCTASWLIKSSFGMLSKTFHFDCVLLCSPEEGIRRDDA
jgi:hypothetical protein